MVESLPQNASSRQAKHNTTKTRQRLRERQQWPPAQQAMWPLLAIVYFPALRPTQAERKLPWRAPSFPPLTHGVPLSSSEERRKRWLPPPEQALTPTAWARCSPPARQTAAAWSQAKLLCCKMVSQKVEKKNIPLNGHVTNPCFPAYSFIYHCGLAGHACAAAVLGTKHLHPVRQPGHGGNRPHSRPACTSMGHEGPSLWLRGHHPDGEATSLPHSPQPSLSLPFNNTVSPRHAEESRERGSLQG